MDYQRRQNVVIFGATGKVGKPLVKQILNKNQEKNITGLISSKGWLYNSQGLTSSEVLMFSNKEIKGDLYTSHEEILRTIRVYQQTPTTFVDVTAETNITPIHLQIVEDTFFKGIVTANKNPLIENLEIFDKLANNRKYKFQCAVMAGAGAIREVEKAYLLKDPIEKISGIFSGTLEFIADGIMKGHKFSELLREADDKGYSEPDSRDDLIGYDVAKKLLILARKAGYRVNFEEISIEPFIPKEAFRKEENYKSFLKRADEYDEYFSKKVQEAKRKKMCLRYIAELSPPTIEDFLGPPFNNIPINIPTKLEISLKEIPENDLFSKFEGTLNGFRIETKERYPQKEPLMIIAPGAGLIVTTGNIRAELDKLY